MMLRKFLAVTPAYPKISVVKVIFCPGKFDCFSFISEAGYRVNVYDTSSLFTQLQESLEDLILQDTCLGIRVDDPGKAAWTLVEVPHTKAAWLKTEWGWKLEEAYTPKPVRSNPGSPSQAKSRKSGDQPPADDALRGL
jgi:hypothetical protein